MRAAQASSSAARSAPSILPQPPRKAARAATTAASTAGAPPSLKSPDTAPVVGSTLTIGFPPNARASPRIQA